jgi:hypothetical protein
MTNTKVWYGETQAEEAIQCTIKLYYTLKQVYSLGILAYCKYQQALNKY